MNKHSKKSKTIIITTSIVISVLVISVVLGIVISLNYHNGSNLDKNKLSKETASIEFFDSNGDRISTNNFSDMSATYEELPQSLIDAFISVEDKRFFKHNGLDYIRIAGAMFNNVFKHSRQGGSTISQQLIKNTQLSNEKTFERKFNEARLAIQLEKEYSKEEILEMYLNAVYFGSGVYGVKEAAFLFFSKELSQLETEESALLAGIVKSPTKYNPLNNYDESVKRKNLVLKLMLDNEKIDENKYNELKNKEIVINKAKYENNFSEMYVKQLINEASMLLGVSADELAHKGCKIYSYYDKNAQEQLAKTIDNPAYYVNGKVNNAYSMLINNENYGISAFYSNFYMDCFNYRRQLGSTIKPLVAYLPSMENNMLSPSSIFNDEKTSFNGYSPSNYNDIYYGKISMRDAIAKSLNIPAVSALNSVGVELGCSYLEDLGFNLDDNDYNLSIALGGQTYGVTPVELGGAYATLANYGLYSKVSFINKIVIDGKVIYINNNDTKRVFSEENCYLMTDMLCSTTKCGTGSKLSNLNFDIACKTGTVGNSNGNSDAYTVSYNTENTMIVWQGSKDNSTLLDQSVTGGGATAMMSKSIYQNLYKTNLPNGFTTPSGIVKVDIDKNLYNNGIIAKCDDLCPAKYRQSELFSSTNAPSCIDNVYSNLSVNNVSFDDKEYTIKFDADPRLNYKVLKRILFAKEEILDEIISKQGEISIKDENSRLVSEYIILPYYFDDNDKEIIGQPYKIKPSNHILPFLN